jgi:histidinol-phosphatase (PHP family)
MLDYHIHSNFSFDSKAQPREICEAALLSNVDEIAITDHYSFAPYSPNYLHFQPEGYFQIWHDLQREYTGHLTVRIGLELDEFANFPDMSNQLVHQYPWDFVIGSTHDLEGGTLRTYLRKYRDQERATHAYYEALYQAIHIGDFDVLAHFDLIKRYIVDEGYPLMSSDSFLSLIDRLFSLIIKQEIALEVNTSGLFQACQSPFPSLALLERYYQLGGRLITLGSDAHAPKDLIRGFDLVIPQLQKIGFSGPVAFQQRKKRIQTW